MEHYVCDVCEKQDPVAAASIKSAPPAKVQMTSRIHLCDVLQRDAPATTVKLESAGALPVLSNGAALHTRTHPMRARIRGDHGAAWSGGAARARVPVPPRHLKPCLCCSRNALALFMHRLLRVAHVARLSAVLRLARVPVRALAADGGDFARRLEGSLAKIHAHHQTLLRQLEKVREIGTASRALRHFIDPIRCIIP